MRKRRQLGATLASAMMLTSFMATSAACSSNGYAEDNEALAQMLFNLSAVTPVDDGDHQGYCTQDSCWFGDDATLSSYLVEVDAKALANQIEDGLAGWQVSIVEDCEDPEADCGADNLMYLTSDGQFMSLLYDDGGSGELLVDAHSDAAQTYPDG